MIRKQITKAFILGLALISIFSCNNEDITVLTDISVTPVEKGVLLVGSTVNFQVIGNNSTPESIIDVTEETLITVNGTTIEGNSFTTDNEPKTYRIKAVYQGFEDIISIQTDKGYVKNVLVEDYTGTWCVNCPRVSWAIEQAKLQSDKVISVGVHVGDEMEMENYEVLTNEFDISIYPTGKINRTNTWSFPEDQNINDVTDLTGFGVPLGLSIDSTIEGSTINATIEVGFENTLTYPLNIVVYLTENGLIYDQLNSTDYYGGPGTIDDFEHNDVLRAIYTHHLGEQIPTDQTVAGNIYAFDIQEVVPATTQNNDKLHLVAFVTDATSNEVINVREVKVGEEQDLQLIE